MLRKLVVALVVLAMAAPAFALVASKDGLVITTQNNNPVNQPLGDRDDVEFNTGGSMFFPPDTNGSASGWYYYVEHVYTNNGADALMLNSLGFPTNYYSQDPIDLPVDWTIDLDNNSVYSITNPYTWAWDGLGQFTPTGADDTSPPDTYTVIDITGAGLMLAAGQSMVWGYENAGLAGQTGVTGQETIGWYVDFWDSDIAYSRTALMQFTGDYATTAAEESSLSQVKSLY
ncbi:MAG: hypothetical protein R3C71_10910 [Candidatus Krumholzibacteriia bacterium]|nr:hypothetical protein [bacterium]